MGNRPGIELNTVQLVSSMGAAVTGAILTSYLGNGGTIVGTAVGAGASTAGFAIYKHYLVRTKEKVAPVIVEHARQWSPATGTQTSRGTSPGAQGSRAVRAQRPAPRPTPTARQWGDRQRGERQPLRRPGFRGSDPAPVRRRPGPPGPGRRPNPRLRAGGHPDRAAVRHGADGQRRARRQSRRDRAPRRAAGFASDGPGNGRDGDGAGPGKHGKTSGGRIVRGLRDRPRWVVMGASSAAVFLVGMLVITLIEFGTGKPIDASVWGRKLVRYHPGQRHRKHSSNSKSER